MKLVWITDQVINSHIDTILKYFNIFLYDESKCLLSINVMAA